MKRTSTNIRWLSLFHPLWLAAALVIGLMLALTATSARALPDSPADIPGGIQGVLYEPDGTTPSGGWIDIHDTVRDPWMGTDANPVDGSFQIPNLPPGIYVLRAYPSPGSPYASSLPVEVEVLSGQWAATTLYLTHVGISGRVLDSDTGNPIEGTFVMAHDDAYTVEQWDTTNITGEFKIGGVAVGVTHTLEAFPPPDSEYVPLPIHYTAVPTATGVVLEMHIPPTNVVGIVHNPAGDPVPGAGVVVFNDYYWEETSADELGGFLFRGLPTNLPTDEFWLHAAPPWGKQGEGLIASEPFTITIPTPATLRNVGVITLPYATKTAIGHVAFEGTGEPAPNALVWAHRLDEAGYADTNTDPTGAFTLSLTGGEWHLGVEPLTWPVTWIFPGPPAWVVFDPDTTPQTDTVDLAVVGTDAWVGGTVVCPGPALCPGDPPHEDIWVELRNDDIGNGVELDPAYDFLIPIPHGWYELVVHVHHPEVQGPEPVPVFVGPGSTLDVGDIELLPKNARIIGQVRNEAGAGVPGVTVVGWQPEGVGRGRAETDASGTYTMPVIGGEWFVEPRPGPEMPFVFRHHPRLTRVAPHGTVRGVDFTLTRAESRIRGAAVDAASYERLWGLDGGASAHMPPSDVLFSDAPMWDGGFELKVKSGHTYIVSVDVPPHAPYVSGNSAPVPVAPGADASVEVPLAHKNAAIEGHLVDGLTGLAPTRPVWAEVFGEDMQGHWVSVGVDPHSAHYGLGVVSGTWHLRAWVDPENGYVAVPTTTVVTVHAHDVASPVNFEIWPIDASISGHVLEPNGVTPVPGAFVFAKGESPFVGYFEAHAQTNHLGYFELTVPEGGYVVGAALPGDELAARGWLNPPPIDVPWVSAASPATGQDLRFRQLDGEVYGAVSFATGINVTATHPAYIWGWSDNGEWAETKAPTDTIHTFEYALPVVSGTVWHVGAVYEDWDNGVYYESAEMAVDLTATGQAMQNLTLSGPYPLPQPFIVSFDGSQMQTIIMPDGVELQIPPGALVVSGTVTLFIFPTREMRPEPGHEIIGAGYEMWAIDQNGQEITQFNKNVVMTFSYPPDAVLESHGISEHLLVPVYYSTLVGRWILANSYVVDTTNNEITLQINHFTKFSLMSTAPAEHKIYLPLVVKNFGG